MAKAVGVFAGAAALLAVIAPAGQANFTSTKCQGANVTGRGASFQTTAQAAWKSDFQSGFCSDIGSFPTITYDPAGSGAGRRAMGERTGSNADGSQSRNQVPRFGATDEPPSTTAVSQMNMGTDAIGDEGNIHVIPVAVGAVTMDVNWPDNCDRSLLPDANETDPASANSAPFLDRVRFTRTQFEAVWNGDASNDNWTEVFPTLAADADCNVAITRVVRFDDSGSTFVLKDYLDHINSGRGWLTTYTTPDTRTWPNATVSARSDCAGSPLGPTGTHLTSSCSTGGSALLTTLQGIDGGVGYADIATARGKGFAITPGGARDDDQFWTQEANASNVFREPTADPNGFRTDGIKGANCQNTTFVNVPTSTLGDWSQVTGVDSAQGYPDCSLTYDLAFDDNATAYALQPDQTAEEAKARTVKDYMTSIVSEGGQLQLFPNDYAPLPESILTKSQTGVNSICWNKAGGSCPSVVFGFQHPASGSPFNVALVPVFRQCGAGANTPTESHAAPLSVGSCVPGTTQVAHVGVQAVASAALTAVVGDPSTPVNTADATIAVNATDVRGTSTTGPDYNPNAGGPDLTLAIRWRLTDFRNGTSGTDPGTTTDLDYNVPVDCTGTADPSIGSTCTVNTTANAVTPGVILEGRRTNIQAFRVRVNDSGANGVRGDTDDRLFLQEGLLAP